MARDFDDFPTYDPVIRDRFYLSSVWSDFLATFVETLQEYLTQYGIFAPKVSDEQRDSLQSPVEGQIIYNTTTNKIQAFENGVWQNLI